MVTLRLWTALAAATALLVAPIAADSTHIHIKVNSKDTTDCSINGVELRHNSMHYYGDKAYVACSRGRAGCYLEERVHAEATQVSCPEKDLQERMDAYKEKHEKKKRDRALSLAVVDDYRLWDSGVVCFAYNADYVFNTSEKSLINDAMRVYEKETNVRFLPLHTCKAESKLAKYCDNCQTYMDFKNPTEGRDCNSSIGVNGQGAQILNLADRCFESDNTLKNSYGSAMHEIGHTLGLYHEHQHPRRSIALFWDEIAQTLWGEMKARDLSIGGQYDPDSIMHYPESYGFCYPRYCSDTVTTDCVPEGTIFCDLNDENDDCRQADRALCDTPKTDAIGQRRFLSQGDLDAINELYPTAMWPYIESRIV